MSLYKTRAVVIKTQEFKEADKLVWLYTEKLGKITAIAKGAKKIEVNIYLIHHPFVMENMYYIRGKAYLIYQKPS
ncbi:hypothetical protein C1146_01915 [Clostridium botulinum]|nr:hypothetical protein C1146_01915 [Clostridium botulinum]